MLTSSFLVALLVLCLVVYVVYRFLPDPWNVVITAVLVIWFIAQYLL